MILGALLNNRMNQTASTWMHCASGVFARKARCVGLSALLVGSLLTAILVFNERGSPLWVHLQHVSARTKDSPPPPKMPLARLLTPEEQARGVTYYGSGSRLRRMAGKLLAGRPITAVALGGSVTYGHGVDDASQAYPALFFALLNASFPHRDHVLLNRGLPGATSQVTAPCVHSMVPPAADLVVVEFSTNDSPSAWTTRGKGAYEGLLRSLLALPGAPAVVLLHHFPWFKAAGDGRSAGLFYREPEGQLTLLSQYYDTPSVSLRSAAWRLMQAGIEGFKVDGTILEGNRDATTGEPIPAAEPGRSEDYLYLDTIHPGPNGHRALAELLGGLLSRAVGEASQGPALAARRHPRLQGLPPPMIPSLQESVPSLCAQLADFRAMVVAQRGFAYRPERPQLARFEEQKWGWASEQPGSWLEIEVDTRPRPKQPLGGSNRSLADAQAAVLVGHLRSYNGMGVAAVACRSGCSCKPSTVDGTSASRASVLIIHSFKVSQHRHCRFRVTVLREPGATPQEGHKVMLAAVMVVHTPREQSWSQQ